MNNSSTQYIYAFLVLIGLGLLGWHYATTSMHYHIPTQQLDTTPDFTISNVTITSFDENGKISSKIKTPQLKHFPKSDSSSFLHPDVLLYQINKAPWKITAERGDSKNGFAIINFINNVYLHQNKSPYNLENTIKTSKITYFPDKHLATTDKFITFEQSSLFVKSIGMNAYLDKNQVDLLSQAWGKYVPENK